MKPGSRLFAIVTVACVVAAIATPAAADPPSHAPAWGYRKKEAQHYVGYDDRQWDRDYGIASGRCSRDEAGAAIGAVVGGAIGSQVASRDNRTVAIIIGAVVGAVIGHEIGEDLDQADRACVGHTLELGRDRVPVRWYDPDRQSTWTVTPTARLRRDGRDCRQFKLAESSDDRQRSTDGMACRVGDGTWRFVQQPH